MELTPNKPPVAMTIHEMFQRLTVIMKAATPAEKQAFKQSWLEGAERMNGETARLREKRVSR